MLVLAVLVPFWMPRWDHHILTSGVTIYYDRYEGLPTNSLRLEEMKRDDVLFYREGLTTTVSVHRIPGSEYLYFKSNGKIDGSYGDALSQLMTSYIPMLLHPKAEQALTIGLGSGMSAKALATFHIAEGDRSHRNRTGDDRGESIFRPGFVKVEKLPARRELSRGRFQKPDLVRREGKAALLQRRDGRPEDGPADERSEDRDYRGAIDRLSRNARNSRHSACSKTGGCE